MNIRNMAGKTYESSNNFFSTITLLQAVGLQTGNRSTASPASALLTVHKTCTTKLESLPQICTASAEV